MKLSNYNRFFEFEGRFYGFNSFTTSLAEFDKEEYEFLRRGELDKIKEESIQKMKEGGFIVEDDFNELEEIRKRFEIGKMDDEVLWLTITPNSNCNFDCIYCFEPKEMRHETGTLMSKEVQDKLVEYVKRVNHNMKELRITWYGGEPLIGIDVIGYLSEKFIKLCEERGIRYRAGIITNGYLLNEENLKKLRKARVTDVQVTIDGPREVHDKRRPLKGGGPTYEVIMKNVEKACNEFPEMNMEISINVDYSNMNSIKELARDVERRGIKDKVFFNLNPVEKFDNPDQKNNTEEIRFFTDKEFSDFSIKMKKWFNDNGFKYTLDYPVKIYNHCGVNKKYFTVIDEKGNLFRCWNDLGIIQRSTGHIDPESLSEEERKEREKRFKPYMEYNPADIEPCKSCDVLPICMGGCFSKKLRDGIGCSVAERADFKYNLENLLKTFIKKYGL